MIVAFINVTIADGSLQTMTNKPNSNKNLKNSTPTASTASDQKP